ncbi:MAG: hypothetical protein A2750_04145 [Candidatus Yanofskybacteria bacterium RIFCSPHIGHO2_01_FULL_45_42]|uniref:Uncharacterized protein n=3 Tax=Candidatus Yanofskyibacteriota TaxID=1752733 RepID=A0A1F8H4E6_9BACT|nr:MAG: hypothetical protein A2750_04145 [Candidatus Yanofskybacteria bacterium RIFCSPHIGHO2_01_FULL_45_42]OGN15415.1 MAG: hypothetical protein A3C81_01620 [Candidatus Yanofskybacteria bacterium RIFCSPHIGHO2_02_FULL_46_19]OGN28254.1 MAG: hypothetical protein A3B17_02085 [Candidatus Yanofskybacteria bacterium RIFCSPLOWO2_01_FULL_45_72]OGN32447.1 MAG: hypothetical protein A3J01_00050 [Candidatus Yanofskybacteria bacterium RIFCSPLOWO2_02_FULL_45_18]
MRIISAVVLLLIAFCPETCPQEPFFNANSLILGKGGVAGKLRENLNKFQRIEFRRVLTEEKYGENFNHLKRRKVETAYFVVEGGKIKEKLEKLESDDNRRINEHKRGESVSMLDFSRYHYFVKPESSLEWIGNQPFYPIYFRPNPGTPSKGREDDIINKMEGELLVSVKSYKWADDPNTMEFNPALWQLKESKRSEKYESIVIDIAELELNLQQQITNGVLVKKSGSAKTVFKCLFDWSWNYDIMKAEYGDYKITLAK